MNSEASISVIPLVSEAVVETERSRAEIKRMAGPKNVPGFTLQGLAQVTFESSFRASFVLSETKSGRWCADLRKVEVDFGFSRPPIVYVAKELDYGSCNFRAVLAHEYEHVDIAKRAVATGTKTIEARLKSVLQDSFPHEGPTKQTAYNDARETIEEAVQSAVAEVLEWAEAENAAIDTPASYSRLGRECLPG